MCPAPDVVAAAAAAAGSDQCCASSLVPMAMQEISGGSRAPRDPTQPPGPEQGCIFGAKQCPGGSLVASPCSDGALRFWQVGAGGSSLAAACKVPLHQGMGSDVAFDPEGAPPSALPRHQWPLHLVRLSRDGDLSDPRAA